MNKLKENEVLTKKYFDKVDKLSINRIKVD